jgi:PhoH-like ATPase
LLDAQRELGPLSSGVPIGDGGTLRVHVPTGRPKLAIALNPSSADHAILQTAIEVRDNGSDKPTVFVTMDVNLRIRADALGLATETYENQAVDVERLDAGVVEIKVSGAEFDQYLDQAVLTVQSGHVLHQNVGVVLQDDSSRGRTALGRCRGDDCEIRMLRLPREGVMGVRPRNQEQSFALDMLLDERIRLVTIMGKAGTGKTLLALAAGLKRTMVDGAFSRLLVSRPVMPLGRDLGYLPGAVEEKLNPWMQPIYDNLEFLLVAGNARQRGFRAVSELFDSGQLQVEPLTYIRGRSLPQQYVIVDEAQNLTPHEVKTIITRCGEGTKIVLTGDPYQIDNPYVDAATNGLTVSADRLRGESLVAHVLLTKGERSELANIAANKL